MQLSNHFLSLITAGVLLLANWPIKIYNTLWNSWSLMLGNLPIKSLCFYPSEGSNVATISVRSTSFHPNCFFFFFFSSILTFPLKWLLMNCLYCLLKHRKYLYYVVDERNLNWVVVVKDKNKLKMCMTKIWCWQLSWEWAFKP
jgi:hypothetical protein